MEIATSPCYKTSLNVIAVVSWKAAKNRLRVKYSFIVIRFTSRRLTVHILTLVHRRRVAKYEE